MLTVCWSYYLHFDYKPKSVHFIWKSQVPDFTDTVQIILQF